MKKPIVVKIGGSTFGKSETVIEDLVTLQKEGRRVVVFHGGANEITTWLKRMNIETKVVDGLRVTDAESLRVVVAVLAGIVNKEIVSQIQAKGGRAIGMSGVDGGLLQAAIKTHTHGLIGEVEEVDTAPLMMLLKQGYMPVIAPPSYGSGNEKILNVNGDPAAGALAAALKAERLIMLTDVEGVKDYTGKLLKRLDRDKIQALLGARVIVGGMIPKVKACVRALSGADIAQIIDGREPHALLHAAKGEEIGTIITATD